jgi:LysM repeat protein
LLNNPGMEGKYVQQCSLKGTPPWVQIPCDPGNYDIHTVDLWATAQVPVGWSAWWRVPNDNQHDPNYFNSYPAYCDTTKSYTPLNCVPWHNPEFRDTAGGPQHTGPSRRMEGDNSQKYFTFYTIHEAGVYQLVSGVKPGQRVRFSVYMEAWSSPFNDPDVSVGQQSMGMKIGIDPYGDNNPWSSNIVWSDVQESYDKFSLFTIEAVAKSNIVTVYTRSQPVYALQHNDVYVDNASLVVVSGGATVKAPVTSKPAVSSSGTITSTRTVSTTVSATPMPITSDTYVVVKGDSLRKIAKQFGLHWSDLAALNNISGPDYKIFVGQVIRLR